MSTFAKWIKIFVRDHVVEKSKSDRLNMSIYECIMYIYYIRTSISEFPGHRVLKKTFFLFKIENSNKL